MSSFFQTILDEQSNSIRLTEVIKSSDIESLEPSPRKYLKIIDEQTITQNLDPIIVPIQIQESISIKQEQKLKINPKLQLKSLKLYLTQVIIDTEEIKYNYVNQYK